MTHGGAWFPQGCDASASVGLRPPLYPDRCGARCSALDLRITLGVVERVQPQALSASLPKRPPDAQGYNEELLCGGPPRWCGASPAPSQCDRPWVSSLRKPPPPLRQVVQGNPRFDYYRPPCGQWIQFLPTKLSAQAVGTVKGPQRGPPFSYYAGHLVPRALPTTLCLAAATMKLQAAAPAMIQRRRRSRGAVCFRARRDGNISTKIPQM